ncbi:MAG: hypothetical protein Q8S96_12835 [Hydrogenophaga sp.]|uniref:hypothetical protein n=1 Tax=Hydrogenophaga sp. TaxID=1904254 RepID=UPI00271781CA|nr:hypothetical protein [Hydrogenophaga sp.]MDO9479045.1 hypothetical protein [Hydrogenophaga sp.]MDP3345323.1 hypothetical protein [Hydrogenophaga sp.]MDP3806124.1 hypothetical protein [Hydrogenophaga sp.]MDP3923229.1 hypothetical protein [Hydrogenophaga sp.]
MAKDILVTESLSGSMMNAGAKLIERLDAKQSEIKSAFWLYFSEDKTWKLIIASPLVDALGPREFYKKVVDANSAASEEEEVISLNDIGVTNTANQIVQLLRFAIGTGDRISGIRFSRNTINGNFIEDTYIYRSKL